MPIRHATILDAILAAAPTAPFVTVWRDEDDETTLTFGDLRERAARAAARLSASGVRRGDRVILVLPQDVEVIEAFVGALWIGAVPAILAYPTFKVDARKYRAGLLGAARNLQARAVVVDPALPPPLVEDAAAGSGDVLVWTTGPHDAPVTPVRGVDANDIGVIQHSAGTTGLQKAVALSHAAVIRQLDGLDAVLHIAPATDVVYSWLPLYHDMGLVACLLLPLVFHVRVVMQSPDSWVVDPVRALQLISTRRCSLAWMPNFAFSFLARRVRPETRQALDLSSLRALVNCSEPVRARSLDEFLAAYAGSGLRDDALHASYAMAETVFAVTHAPAHTSAGPRRLWVNGAALRDGRVESAAGNADARCLVSSGRCLPGTDIRIVDSAGTAATSGATGEIVVRSASLFGGYHGRPDLTARVLRDGWYATGDIGFLWEGEVFITGRKTDLMIVAGRNIHPEDVEECAGQHAAIRDGRVAAFGIMRPELGTQEVVVVAEAAPGTDADAARRIGMDVKAAVAATLGVTVARVYVRPPGWIVKSTAGKPARRDTRKKLASEEPDMPESDD